MVSLHYTESSLLHDNVAFVLCLDSLGSGDELFLHVSRPPKPETPQFSFIKQLEDVRPHLMQTSRLQLFIFFLFFFFNHTNTKYNPASTHSILSLAGYLLQVFMGKVWNHTQEDQPARVCSCMGA